MPISHNAVSPSFSLRDYQSAAVAGCRRDLDRRLNSLAAMPCGSGKSVVIAALVAAHRRRVLVCVHVLELVDQLHATLSRYLGDQVGMCCGSRGAKSLAQRVTVGTIQTVAKVLEHGSHSPVELMVIDEAHLIDPTQEANYGGAIRQLRQQNNFMRLAGFTATPFRDGELLYGTGKLFDNVSYEVEQAHLIRDGYLVRLESAAGEQLPQEVIATIEDDDDDAFMALVADHADDICRHAAGRHRWLVFGVSIRHSSALAAALVERGVKAAHVDGSTAKRKRSQLIDDFRAGRLTCLVNCGVLTTGFDVPAVDCVALVRKISSCSLYLQIIGRAQRIADGKTTGLVIDFGRNLDRFGPPEVAVRREITRILERKKIAKGGGAADEAAPKSRQFVTTVINGAANMDSLMADAWRIEVVGAKIRAAKTPGKAQHVAVNFELERDGRRQLVSHSLCPLHGEKPRFFAERFVRDLGGEAPESEDLADWVAAIRAVRRFPSHARIKLMDGRWWQIHDLVDDPRERPPQLAKDDHRPRPPTVSPAVAVSYRPRSRLVGVPAPAPRPTGTTIAQLFADHVARLEKAQTGGGGDA